MASTGHGFSCRPPSSIRPRPSTGPTHVSTGGPRTSAISSAYVNNLFDKQYVTGVNNITATTLGTPFVGLTELWGLDLTYTY